MSFAKSAAAGVVAGIVAAGAFELFGRTAAPSKSDGKKGRERLAAAPLGESMPLIAGAALGLGYGVLATFAPSLRTGFGAGYGLATNAMGGPSAPVAPAASTSAGGNGLVSDLLIGAAVQGVKHVIAEASKPGGKGDAKAEGAA